ncbi:beta-lactamase [Penicillium odoratum]|uniref:beta-lactamase n=1 Tax=Penicillium odoratum TaxID=1167516 RepID=UPI0025487198|nr:beta-lactamase [Penicillium odoratum]KAJ5752249.1 beta-lactamase [Penicillium odoratum]
MSYIQGHCAPQFKALHKLISEKLQSNEELGVSLSVIIGDRTVVDIWGGYKDAARTKPWTKETITTVWSLSKIITNLAALLLVDRGQLDPSAPVANYWPEFAANGKENILIKHILSHTSGVSSWELPNTIVDIYNTRQSTAKLAAQKPWWSPPGVQSGYHVTNQGHMVGEIVYRVTGKLLGAFIRDELAAPLRADFQLGLSQEPDWDRVADLIPGPPVTIPDGIDLNSVFAKTFMSILMPAETAMTPGFRNAEIGATNGFSNARALAKIGSMVANGGAVGGKRFMSEETIHRMLEVQSDGVDLVLGCHLRFGLGVGLPTPETLPWLPADGRVAYWGGWGGSFLVMDVDRKVSIAYVMNKMGEGTLGNHNTAEYVKVIYAILDELDVEAFN